MTQWALTVVSRWNVLCLRVSGSYVLVREIVVSVHCTCTRFYCTKFQISLLLETGVTFALRSLLWSQRRALFDHVHVHVLRTTACRAHMHTLFSESRFFFEGLWTQSWIAYNHNAELPFLRPYFVLRPELKAAPAQILLPSVWCQFQCSCRSLWHLAVFAVTKSIDIAEKSAEEDRRWTSRLSNPCFWSIGLGEPATGVVERGDGFHGEDNDPDLFLRRRALKRLLSFQTTLLERQRNVWRKDFQTLVVLIWFVSGKSFHLHGAILCPLPCVFNTKVNSTLYNSRHTGFRTYMHACNKQHCQQFDLSYVAFCVQTLSSYHVQNLSCEVLWHFNTFFGMPVFHSSTIHTFHVCRCNFLSCVTDKQDETMIKQRKSDIKQHSPPVSHSRKSNISTAQCTNSTRKHNVREASSQLPNFAKTENIAT